jgi:D-alanyl-D-alanine carboxypeptidase
MAPAPTDAVAARVQQAVDDWRAAHHVTGVSVAVRAAGEPIAQVASGVRLVREGVAPEQLSVDDTFQAASITKLIAAGLTLQQVEEGRVSLAEHLDGWRPDIAQANRITVGNLLDHRSGIDGYITHEFREALYTAPGTPWSHERAVQHGLTQPRAGAPGERHSYSNTNYLLVQELLEQRTGMTFDALLRAKLADPLGIAGDAAYMTTLDGPRTATAVGHGQLFGRAHDAEHLYVPGGLLRSVVGADGGMITTAPALARMGEAILWKGGAALGAEAHAAITGSADTTPGGYGLGAYRGQLGLADGRDLTVYGHNGGIDGYASLLLHAPQGELTIALLANDSSASGNLEELAARVLEAAAPR